MTSHRYIPLLSAMALLLVGCGALQPSTIKNAIVGHAGFPSLSMAVSECVGDYPAIREQIKPPFNELVDLWTSADKLKPDATLLIALADAQHEVAAARRAWVSIKTTIVDAGVDCGPAVVAQVRNIERTFTEIQDAIQSNERAVYLLEWGNLLASVVLGRRGDVVRM